MLFLYRVGLFFLIGVGTFFFSQEMPPLKAYPNPFQIGKEVVYISPKNSGSFTGSLLLEVYTSSWQKIYEREYQVNNATKISWGGYSYAREVSPGLYYLRITYRDREDRLIGIRILKVLGYK